MSGAVEAFNELDRIAEAFDESEPDSEEMTLVTPSATILRVA